MDEQLGSRFLSLPAELRRVVYQHLIPPSIHVFLSQQRRLTVSVCLKHPESPSFVEGDRYQRGSARRLGANYHDTKPPWRRRIMSSWGAHWECEAAIGANELCGVGVLLSVCKTM